MTTAPEPTRTTSAARFPDQLRAEWTKLRSVRSTARCLIAAIALTVLISFLSASGSTTDANSGAHVVDQFHFVHRPLVGNGTIVARVAAQRASNEWAKAGVMLKDGTASGSPNVALMVTPGHGVRLQGDFRTEVSGRDAEAPLWLRLTRRGSSVTGDESTNGRTWQRVGTVTVASLPDTVQAGLFVTSPPTQKITRRGTTTTATFVPTVGQARFTDVRIDTRDAGASSAWSDVEVTPDAGGGKSLIKPGGAPGTVHRSAGAFTVTGSGDVAGIGVGGFTSGDNDVVVDSLAGVQIGLIAIVALAVAFITSEFKTSLIRTTFAASPRRGRVLVAKALVVGGTVFVAGLLASVAAFLIAQPIQRGNGFAPPSYPHLSLADGPVLRAVVGTALFLSLVALLSLGIGALLRRTASSITVVIGLVVVPQIVAPMLSLAAERWVRRVTPSAGLAIQQTRERFDTAIGPWAGLAVLAAYAAAALGAAYWFLRRRDA